MLSTPQSAPLKNQLRADGASMGHLCYPVTLGREKPERALISPTLNAHTATDKEVVHRVYQGCAVKIENVS